jgi:hypothetical protein
MAVTLIWLGAFVDNCCLQEIVYGKFNLSLCPSHGNRMHNWSRIITTKPEREQHKTLALNLIIQCLFLLPTDRQRPLLYPYEVIL